MPPGAKPKASGTAVTRHKPTHPWQHATTTGWQHGAVPKPPAGLTAAGRRAWRTWLGSWWASFYRPEDVPGLELTVRTYDAALTGSLDVAKAVPLLDRYGITPKGRQDLRWAEPKADAPPATGTASGGELHRLRVVDAG